MGLNEIVGVRQYTTFDGAGKVQKMYEVTFTTQKAKGEFTFDVPRDEYSAKAAVERAQLLAEEIDEAIS